MDREEKAKRLVLSRIQGIGPQRYKKLIETFGSAAEVFSVSYKTIRSVGGMPKQVAEQIVQTSAFETAKREFDQLAELGIVVLECFDKTFPPRLLWCPDHPIFLYQRGKMDILDKPMLAIVGTRNPSTYGQSMCEEIIADLAPYQPVIVSGLAVGIDHTAHQAALKNGLISVAVLASGLDKIYPDHHRSLAYRLCESGGLFTEYSLGEFPEKNNFPERNRIVAGMCDATIVIETGLKGGSMITADLATQYQREVFCVPGRSTDPNSAGCNYLIKNLKAQMLTEGEDLVNGLGWKKKNAITGVQASLFPHFSTDEQIIIRCLQQVERIHLDALLSCSGFSLSQVSSLLLDLEMKDIIRSHPGKYFALK